MSCASSEGLSQRKCSNVMHITHNILIILAERGPCKLSASDVRRNRVSGGGDLVYIRCPDLGRSREGRRRGSDKMWSKSEAVSPNTCNGLALCSAVSRNCTCFTRTCVSVPSLRPLACRCFCSTSSRRAAFGKEAHRKAQGDELRGPIPSSASGVHPGVYSGRLLRRVPDIAQSSCRARRSHCRPTFCYMRVKFKTRQLRSNSARSVAESCRNRTAVR